MEVKKEVENATSHYTIRHFICTRYTSKPRIEFVSGVGEARSPATYKILTPPLREDTRPALGGEGDPIYTQCLPLRRRSYILEGKLASADCTVC